VIVNMHTKLKSNPLLRRRQWLLCGGLLFVAARLAGLLFLQLLACHGHDAVSHLLGECR